MNYDLMRRLQEEPSEEHLWDMILSYQNIMFKTYSGLPFTYEVRKGRNGEYTKELWIDRREKSKIFPLTDATGLLHCYAIPAPTS